MNVAAAIATACCVFLATQVVRWPNRGPVVTPHWVAEAGWPWGPTRFAILRLGLGLVTFLAVRQVTSAAAVAFPPALFAVAFPVTVLRRRLLRRRAALLGAWPDGLRDLSASVAAGLSLPQALESLAHSGPLALRQTFAQFPALLPAVGMAGALERIRHQAADATTDRVVEVLLLAHERGGRMLPVLLNDLAEATARDGQLLERMATAQLELRINARAVFALPWLVLAVLTARPGPFRQFYASSRGFFVVGVGAALSVLGVVLVERLGRMPVEPRVFAGGGAPR